MIDTNKHYRMAIFLVFWGAYDDVFDIFIRQFKKYWPDCQYPIIIVNPNVQQGVCENAVVIQEDKRKVVTKDLILKTIEADYYLGFEVDRIIMNHVNSRDVEDILDFMDSHSIHYFRCNASKFKKHPTDKYPGYDHYYHIPANEPYGVCGSTVIWSRELYQKKEAARDAGYAWEAEQLRRAAFSTERWVADSATDDRNVFHILHCIEKNKWIREAQRKLMREGYDLRTNSRSTQSYLETVESYMKDFSKNIPGKTRYKMKKILNRFGLTFTTEY